VNCKQKGPHDNSIETIRQQPRDVKVASRADVVVVGGGPAGFSAALAAARNGAKVTLLERYNHLGGLASGGMVLVLDDMWDNHLNEISVRGTCMTMIERLAARACVYPRENEWGYDPAAYRRWAAGAPSTSIPTRAAAPDLFRRRLRPDGWKRAALDMVPEAGIELRLHSWFSHTLVEDGRSRAWSARARPARRRSWARWSSTPPATWTWPPRPARRTPAATTS
jgi:glycine/D-amino acid oxidase-like deaminating enzyme